MAKMNVQEVIVNESAQAHSGQMLEIRGNISSANNIVRHSAAKKFDQVDAIESSAVERILSSASPRVVTQAGPNPQGG